MLDLSWTLIWFQGKLTAQVGHASLRVYQTTPSQVLTQWESDGYESKIYRNVLQRNETLQGVYHLYSQLFGVRPRINRLLTHYSGSDTVIQGLIEAARKANIQYRTVHDAGRTQIQFMTLTVLSIGPDDEDRICDLVDFLPEIQ